jgi:hypothetical protein
LYLQDGGSGFIGNVDNDLLDYTALVTTFRISYSDESSGFVKKGTVIPLRAPEDKELMGINGQRKTISVIGRS